MAGKLLGLRVRTTVVYDVVYVRAIDLPLPEWVRQRSQRQLADHAVIETYENAETPLPGLATVPRAIHGRAWTMTLAGVWM